MNDPQSMQPARRSTSPSIFATITPDQVLIVLRLIWSGAMSWAVLAVYNVELAGPWSQAFLPIAKQIALFGALLVLAELLIAALRLVHWRWAVMRAPHSYVRIRIPNPALSSRALGTSLSDGGDFWHAAQQLFPAPSSQPAPWMAMTLSATADEPIQFGAVIGGGSAMQQRSWVRSLRQLVIGHNSAAVIDTVADPLESAIERASGVAGSVLAWGEFLLPYSPAYPLRVPEDAHSDLLGPLITQLRPHTSAVRYAEAQIITQACPETQLHALGWRAVAARRLAQLRAKNGLVLSSDARALERKLASPVAHCVVRAVLVAESRMAAQEMLRTIGVMLGQYAARSGQALQAFRLFTSGHTRCDIRSAMQRYLIARAPRCIPPAPVLLPWCAWHAPAVLGAAELGGMWHLPSPMLAQLVAWLPARHLPAPPHAFIGSSHISAPTGQSSRRIVFGHAMRSDGQFAAVGPSLYDLRTIGHLTAGMGAGKSRFLANLCEQIIDEGFTLIDGKGDDAGNLTATVRRYLPREAERRVVLLDIADIDWPISINPLAGVNALAAGATDRAVAQIQSIFARLDPVTWMAAPGMQQFLEMATRLVLEAAAQPTIAHIRQVLVDSTYRHQLLDRCQRLEIRTFWQVIVPASNEQQRSSLSALLRRFDRLLLSQMVRGLVSQAQSTFRFAEAFEQRLIVLCPIPHIAYGPLAATAAMLIFQSLLRAAFERPGSAATRRDYPLVVDEFQVLVEHGATQDVAAAITQLRSLGIPALYAHQALAQVGDLRDLLLVNAENRLILRTQEPDASAYAHQYAAAGLSAADIASQEPGEHQYARFTVGGSVIGPISLRPLGWPAPLTVPPEPYSGPAWQQHLPGDAPAAAACASAQEPLLAAYDRSVLQLIYATPYSDAHASQLASQLNPAEWALLLERWRAIAAAQRQYILDHPGCIPDRDQRVQWLSRLGYARPRLLAEAEQLRIQPGVA